MKKSFFFINYLFEHWQSQSVDIFSHLRYISLRYFYISNILFFQQLSILTLAIQSATHILLGGVVGINILWEINTNTICIISIFKELFEEDESCRTCHQSKVNPVVHYDMYFQLGEFRTDLNCRWMVWTGFGRFRLFSTKTAWNNVSSNS